MFMDQKELMMVVEKAPAAICRKIANAKLQNNKTIDVWGDGNKQEVLCISKIVYMVQKWFSTLTQARFIILEVMNKSQLIK